MNCWFLNSAAPIYLLGGKTGDVLQMLPCFHEVYRRIGKKPKVITSQEFCGVYDGTSYVEPYPIPHNWWNCIEPAQKLASQLDGKGVCVQFWNAPPVNGDEIGYKGKGWTTLQCHGKSYGCNISLDPNYGTSMARRCGFTQEEWKALPLIIDKRVPVREQKLIQQVVPGEKRPILLYNFTAKAFGFPWEPEVLNPIMQKYGRDFRLIDLGKIKAERIFDLLGLYDKAVGLVTADTATAHLAVASKIPTIWLTVHQQGSPHPEWCGSVPRGNVSYHCNYAQVPSKVPEILNVIGGWK